jgi:ketosteroid isomerase-like protein
MARKAAIELAREWFSHAEAGDSEAMADLLADDAHFYAESIRGKRFTGRDEIESFLADSGFEATAYSYTEVDEEYAIVTVSLRRRLPSGGIADSTLAMVIKAEGDEIVCLDAFSSLTAALASLQR